MCEDGCGDLGETCCETNLCQETMWCLDDGTCKSAPFSSQCKGSNTYAIKVRSAASKCAHEPLIVKANSPQEAQQCSAAVVQAAGAEVLSVETTVAAAIATEYTFCDPNYAFHMDLSVYAHSTADATACMEYFYCALDNESCGWQMSGC
jgi:hypothetical protein